MKPFDPVEIDWTDSCSDAATWTDADDFDYAEHDKSMQFKTTGYFLKKTKTATYVTLSQRNGKCGGKLVNGPFAIPNRAITKIRKLG